MEIRAALRWKRQEDNTMGYWDWERVGEDIKRTVQDAVDSRDFRQLNETITNTVNVAGIRFTGGMGGRGNAEDMWDAGQRFGTDRRYRRNRSRRQERSGGESYRYSRRERSGREEYGSGQNRSGREEYGSWQSRSGGAEYGSGQAQSGTGERYRYGRSWDAETGSRGYGPSWQNLDLNQLKQPVLYRRTVGLKVSGIVFAAVGYSISGSLGLACLITLVSSLFMDVSGALLAVVIMGILAAVFGVMAGVGTSLLRRVKRFQTYIRELDGKEYCNIEELAERLRKKEKYIVKDLEKMIERRWFLQGHLDDQKTCLMTSNQMYDEYRRLKVQMEEQRRTQQEEAGKSEERKRREQEDREKKREQMDPQIQAVIEAGNRYIERIRECNDAIPGEEISEKISRMEIVTRRIFARVEEDPDSVSDIRRMMEYYLPTAVKLLEAYEELDSQPVQGENILSSKREIENTLDTLNSAFEKLLDNLFQETAWDVSSDISVLRTMLAQEGLTENDFTTGGQK